MKEEKKYNQAEYDKKWIEKNREKRRYLSYRSTTRTFLNNYAELEDLKEIEELVEKRKKILKNNKKTVDIF
jgi:hypothetical protein